MTDKTREEIWTGPAIDEQIISDGRVDPDPIPGDRGGTGSNMSLLEMFNTCISVASIARQWYQAVNTKPEVPETAPKALSPGGDAAEDRTDTERSAFAFFQKIAGADHEVDALELQQVMNHVFKKELKFQGFSIESCRSMVALMDLDESGKLGFDEFIQLWRNLRNWCEVFKKHDTDSSSTINAGELRDAFREVGINVNRQILRLLVNRYGHRAKASATIEDQMYFDDFIYCSLKMKRCIEVWNNKKARPAMQLPGAFSVFARGILDRPPAGAVHESSFTLDEFMRNVLYS